MQKKKSDSYQPELYYGNINPVLFANRAENTNKNQNMVMVSNNFNLTTSSSLRAATNNNTNIARKMKTTDYIQKLNLIYKQDLPALTKSSQINLLLTTNSFKNNDLNKVYE